MEGRSFIEWIRIMRMPMVIDHELTYRAINSEVPTLTTMRVFFRKGGVLLAIKMSKKEYGKQYGKENIL